MGDSESEPPKLPGFIYTFYSYKGGVGRSMAMANVGVLMALEGHKVLLVDWDLEAPGLEAYFQRTPACKLRGKPEKKPGIVDLLEARVSGDGLSWKKCLIKASFRETSLDIVSAGRRTADYRHRVQQLDWEALFEEHSVGNYLDDLREEWRNEYDFILIDSRTGITDIGDICTVLMPDALVTMFVSNYQNVEGVKSIIGRAREARTKLPVNRNMLMVMPLHGRDETTNEYSESMRWKEIFANELGFLFKEWLPREVDPLEVLTKVYVPYVANWSFGDRIPVLENRRELNDPNSIGSAFLRVSTLLSSRLDWYAVYGKASTADIRSTRIELDTALREKKMLESGSKRRTRRAVMLGAAATALGTGIITWLYSAVEQVTSLELQPRLKVKTDVALTRVAYSPDGSRVAAGSSDGTVFIWTPGEGRELFALKGHRAAITRISFTNDGKRMVSSSHDQTARLWDARSGKEIAVLRGHEDVVWTAFFNADGSRIVTSSYDTTARVWNGENGEVVAVMKGHKDRLSWGTFSDSGKQVLTASTDTTARTWDTETGEEMAVMTGHTGPVWHAIFAYVGSRIRVVTVSEDSTARVWEAETGEEIHVLKGHNSAVNDVAIAGEARVATVSFDKTARLWDIDSGKELAILRDHAGRLLRVATRRDRKRIVTVAEEGPPQLWNTETATLTGVLGSKELTATYSAFSSTGQSVATVGEDGELRVYDIAGR